MENEKEIREKCKDQLDQLNFEMKSKLGDSTFQVQRTSEGFLLLPPPDHTDEPSMTIAVTDTTVVHMDQVLDLQKNDSISGKASDIRKLMCTDSVVENCFNQVAITSESIVLKYQHSRNGEMVFTLNYKAR